MTPIAGNAMKFRQDVGNGRLVCESTRVRASPRGQAGGWAGKRGDKDRQACKKIGMQSQMGIQNRGVVGSARREVGTRLAKSQ